MWRGGTWCPLPWPGRQRRGVCERSPILFRDAGTTPAKLALSARPRLRRAENKSLSIRDTVPREPISLLHSCSSEPNAPPAFSKGIGKEWVAYILCVPNTEGDGMGFLKPSCSRSVPGQTFWRRLPASYLILWRITFWGPPQRPSFTYEHVVWQITVPPLFYSRLYRTSTRDWSPLSEILGTLRWLPVGIP